MLKVACVDVYLFLASDLLYLIVLELLHMNSTKPCSGLHL
jgi:hypothetical protein